MAVCNVSDKYIKRILLWVGICLYVAQGADIVSLLYGSSVNDTFEDLDQLDFEQDDDSIINEYYKELALKKRNGGSAMWMANNIIKFCQRQPDYCHTAGGRQRLKQEFIHLLSKRFTRRNDFKFPFNFA
ncbi:hypothetical protein HELRODRAFT_173024 [Helobdella robusta]|uniref:Uncharacterized protein n=1 Tax=Helobdella robusta TaxID=6412 RepID=T1F6A0_HELRO|nr:hypothetical protein HELRODRAFT_173024 [Helobdella robusta]ESO03979.1 hypothetical protein HELRODRAFT_173024 [Helobdella robusta]